MFMKRCSIVLGILGAVAYIPALIVPTSTALIIVFFNF